MLRPEQPELPSEPRAGSSLGRYELLAPIASGGMATVWAARLKGTRGFQKIVAVKTMLPALRDQTRFEKMFLDEAALASRVRHPHAVEILDLGEQDGLLYLVMEWIDGVPLGELMAKAAPRGGIPLPIAIRIASQACAALHAAHELRDATGQPLGLVHRDVTPHNVMITYGGVAKLLDFGIAAVARGAAPEGLELRGKAAYSAPEQVMDGPIDRRTDLFAMGIVLYEMTAGVHPFRGENDLETMQGICSPERVATPRRASRYPASLERVVLQALAKEPADRFATASDLLRALDQVLPLAKRVSTDGEVAEFVRSVLGDAQEERAAELAAALRNADDADARAAEPSPAPEPSAGEAPAPVASLDAGEEPSSAKGRPRVALRVVAVSAAALALIAGGAALRGSGASPTRGAAIPTATALSETAAPVPSAPERAIAARPPAPEGPATGEPSTASPAPAASASASARVTPARRGPAPKASAAAPFKSPVAVPGF